MKTLRNGIIVGVLLLVIMCLSFYLFAVRIDRLTTKDIQSRLIETAENNAKSMKLIFDKDIIMMTSMAKHWENGEDLMSAESLAYLKEMQINTSFIRMGLNLPDGTSYTSDGKQLDVSDTEYLDKVLEGHTYLTGLQSSDGESDPSFAVVVPVYRYGKVIAAMHGIYKSDMLMDVINLHTFDGQGYFNLININGDFLIKSSNIHKSYSETNLFNVLKDVTFQEPFSLNTMQQNMNSQKSAFTIYRLNNEERCAYYTPVNIGQWYILSIVPTQYLLQQKLEIDISVILLLLILIVLFTFLIGYIVWQGRQSRKLLHKERDYLEHILNSIPLSLFITKADRNLNFVNKVACDLFSCDSNVLGQNCNYFKISICGTPNCAIDKLEQTGSSRTYFEMNDRSYMVITSILSEDTNLEGKYIEVIQDITEQVNAQKALEEKTLELETMSENLVGGILITTLEDGFPVVCCNHGYLDLLGNIDLKIEGKNAIQWAAPEDVNGLKEHIFKQLKNSDYVSLEHRMIRDNGEKIWVTLHGKRATLHGKEVCVWLTTDISSKHEAELELKISEERNRIAIQNTEDIIIDYDILTHTMYHSSKAMDIYGVESTVENMPYSVVDSGTIMPESIDEYLDLFRQIFDGTPKCSCTLKARAADGRVIWNRMSFTTIFDIDGVPVRAIGILQDITREKEAEKQYKREARYRELTEKNDTFYYEADMTHHRFISGHEQIIQSYYKEPTDDFDTIIQLLLTYMVYEEDRDLVKSHVSWDSVMGFYESGMVRNIFEYRRISANGECAWVECSLHFFLDDESSTLRCVGSIKNIDEAKQRELAFKRKSEHDLLTGLYNKVTTEILVKEFTDTSSKNNLKGTFMLIDLDDFKSVNDTLGHSFGDAVLSEISRKLLLLFNETDIVGRIGGDEFVAFMCNINDEYTVTAQAQKICDMFHSTYTGINNNYKISGSIGISRYPIDGDNFQTLYKNADQALYYAKGCGKDRYSLYHVDLPDNINIILPAKEIDSNFGKIFSENITEYVLKILHESTDSHRAINAILELISKHFGFNRGYIFKKIECIWHNSFEWENYDTVPLTEYMQKFSDDMLEINEIKFDKNGIFLTNSNNHQTEKQRIFFEKQFIVSPVWFAVIDDGVFNTIIGFDNCINDKTLDNEHLSVLKQVSMLMSTFLNSNQK